MPYSFDERMDRRNTDCMKWGFLEERGYDENTLAMWIADMDFRAPEEVISAVHACADHGIFGYTDLKPDFFHAVHDWFLSRHGFSVREEWMQITPGIVFALAATVRAFTKIGEKVVIQPPVYAPFTAMTRLNKRELAENPLRFINGRYEMDFADLEEKFSDPAVKLMILCSPHNPVGRVWTAEELTMVGRLAKQYGVVVVSDEIHCDFAFPGHKHHMYGALGADMLDNSVICAAPSKTFNIAGMQLSVLFTPNQCLREKLSSEIASTGFGHPSVCGLAAGRAAYRHGAGWLDALLVYIQENVRFVKDYLQKELPMVHAVDQDGTFLMWLDFRGLSLSHGSVWELLTRKANVWLDDGKKFGTGGEGFMRMNIGCPRSVLQEALERIKKAIV